ncbi:NADH-quinone oxidoreductase subunit L [Actinomyces sp. B33]|uniref:NADH-quinone oxidoreductase subunit L n=1 Tax=Actinomyces sp. B33 TaxID=2942131 RepID=UPI00233FC17C|nr:NADH-quinone oxidoreductase subunit L [Actinomyces sp. B33]MDC4233554.1 NADH-quinone oxidoreductase subunit L [Actinomyces sp. B33]
MTPSLVLPADHVPAGPVETAAATGAASYAWLLILIPLACAAVLLLAGRRADRWGHLLATGASWASFVVGAVIVAQFLGLDPSQRRMAQTLFTWIPAGDLTVDVGLLVDPLSLTFVVLVTFVGSLIHVYAIAYMEHDRDRRRFFAYLNLFIAAMLTLVLGDSYAVLFVGWEGVGLASYLLIGFWNHVPANARAAKKAFVMNRVGDMGMLLAMMAMVANVHSVTFDAVAAGAAAMPTAQATLIGLFLLVAACGKSAQFPLQAWLGDAMAGPTPVSALIHAATMVTAGVYLVVRSGAVYVAAPAAATAVAVIGAITLVFGAVVGSAKDDMKKVLAASTMSQIGYMMLGAGLGPIGWAFAIFHLFTHGFFKALMFLGAGSVMHAMMDQVNMRRFGALRTAMKTTWITFMMGWLAILGVPPLSGFWSKDKIIEAAFSARDFGGADAPWMGWVLGLVALVGAGVTAFYMSRLFFMTFHGKARWTSEAEGAGVHPHESSPLMTVPMIVLAVGAVLIGPLLSIGGFFIRWLAPAIGETEHVEPVLPVLVIQAATLAVVLVGALVAWRMYGAGDVPTAVPAGNALTEAARRDLYQDDVNATVFVAPAAALTAAAASGDRRVVDGAIRGVAAASAGIGRAVAATQSGFVRGYASYILGGVVLALAVVLGFRL